MRRLPNGARLLVLAPGVDGQALHETGLMNGKRKPRPRARGMITPAMWAAKAGTWYIRDGDGCWPWQMATDREGAGVVRNGFGNMRVARIAWVSAHGPIPQSVDVVVRCGNRACVNPAHMELRPHGWVLRRSADSIT